MTTPEPLVSICCITYNHENFIKQALDSFLMQETSFPIEVIIHDDASTDDTVSIISEYQKKYPHLIKAILQTENQYSSKGFGFLLDLFREAKGKYIALCEGDDYWIDPIKLEKQLSFLEKNDDYILCFHRCIFRIENGDGIVFQEQERESIEYHYGIKNLLINWGIPTASMVFRNVIQEAPSWFYKVASADIALCMFLYEKGAFRYFEDVMSVYRITGKGLSQYHHDHRMIHYRSYLYSKLNEYFDFKYEKEIYEALFEIMCLYGGSAYLETGKKYYERYELEKNKNTLVSKTQVLLAKIGKKTRDILPRLS